MPSRFRNTVAGLSFVASCLFGTLSASAMTYTAQQNDTFWSLSKRFHTSVAALEKANPRVNPFNIYPGLKLNIPTKPSSHKTPAAASTAKRVIYTVRAHDTLWGIAVRHHLSVSALLKRNPGLNPSHLRPGQKIVLSAGTAHPAGGQSAVKALAKRVVHSHLQLSGRSGTVANTSGGAMVLGPNGQPLHYSRVIDATATAYTVHDNGDYGAVDCFGNPLHLGTIAVDPKVIPLGSTIYVTGYNYAGLPAGGFIGHATDRGGAIVGNRIDIFLPVSTEQALQFGVQHVKVYILSH